jgi:polar amino acid transport system substrate-binding protein
MKESPKDSTSIIIKLLVIIISALILVILLLLGWRITKLTLFGIVEVAPPPTTTPETIMQSSPELAPIGASAETDGLLSEIISRGFIIIATDPNYAPQSFLNMSGRRRVDTKCPSDALTTAEMQGFDVDVARKIGDAIGVETCFATPSWDTVTAGNWGDRWDISVGSMIITTDRQKVLNFSTPYYYTLAVVAVREDSGFTSLADLAGQNLCAGVATTYEAWINNDITTLGLPAKSIYATPPPGVKAFTLETDQECAQSIAEGRTDFAGYVTSSTVADANIAAGMPIRKLGNPVYSEDIAVAIDKTTTLDTASLLKLIDNTITAMHNDGTLSALSVQWFGQDLTVK